ncbi:MAG: adenosylmethionine--8-amino-7-oxononanoate transaminase [Oxalobacter sp.]|nr:adenosylmethionine--8-amino-7-oxononanoate transaminase [Oxalobacter sp.]
MTSASEQWMARSLKSVWHPCSQMKHHETLPLLAIKSGQGVWLNDQDGNRYFDAISSWWTNLFGHTNPTIGDAIKKQLDTLEHAMLAGCTHEPVVELSERLSELTGGRLGHCFYGSDGASAIEIALKMSFHYWKNTGNPEKQAFICLEHSYHGETIGAMSVTDVAIFRDAYAPLIRNAYLAPSPDPRSGASEDGGKEAALAAADGLEKILKEKSGTVAAVILEPLVQCAAGFIMYHPVYLKQVRELCDRYRVHMIADEIAVGMGRTGSFFACDQADIRPDFLCLSKGITGGYLPLSVVMTTDTIYRAFYDDAVTRGFLHSHSYTGNPLACRAALATLDLFERNDVIARNRRLSSVMTQLLEPIRQHGKVRHFRNKGMLWAFDVGMLEEEVVTFPRRFFQVALRHEVLMRPIGNTVYLMPPYVTTEKEAAWLAERVGMVLQEVIGA